MSTRARYLVVGRTGDEPVLPAQVRLHARLDDDDPRGELIAQQITAAREYAEDYSRRSIGAQTRRALFDAFPRCGAALELEFGPVQAVTAIEYVDPSGVLQTMALGDVVAIADGKTARLAPLPGIDWPTAGALPGAVRITFSAGDDGQPVPANIVQWMLLRITAMLDNPAEVAVDRNQVQPLPFVDRMLDHHWAPVI